MSETNVLKVSIHVSMGSESNQVEKSFELEQGEIDSRFIQGLDASMINEIVNKLEENFNEAAGETGDQWTIGTQKNLIMNSAGEWVPRY